MPVQASDGIVLPLFCTHVRKFAGGCIVVRVPVRGRWCYSIPEYFIRPWGPRSPIQWRSQRQVYVLLAAVTVCLFVSDLRF